MTYEDVPETDAIEIGAVLAALADPMRRAVVLDMLERDPEAEHACGSFALPLAKSTRTYHWRILRRAGVVRQRDAGNGSFVRLRRADLAARFPGLLDAIRAAETRRDEPRRAQTGGYSVNPR
jgi:DNA-binding transcriptional ArsR family regulator